MSIAIDTNVLVRYLVKDEPRQSKVAAALINAGLEESGVFVSHIVLCELVWVLRRSYGIEKADIVKALTAILHEPGFAFESRAHVQSSLKEYLKSHGDFADYLIGHSCIARGCERVYTFDQKLKNSQSFQVLDR